MIDSQYRLLKHTDQRDLALIAAAQTLTLNAEDGSFRLWDILASFLISERKSVYI